MRVIAGLLCAFGRCHPISRSREPNTEDGATVAAPKANTITTTVKKATTESKSDNSINQT
jgi:hypothetical protein